MFIEMKKQRLDFMFGQARLWLRYDIRAFYNIENSGYDPFDILSVCKDPKAVRCFLENGLADWYSTVPDEMSVTEYVNKLMSAEGYQTELLTYIQAAVILALPKRKVGNTKKNTGRSDILGLMTAFVDVMKAPEIEFWKSTLREASERWERYAVAMGYQKPVEVFTEFDDE